MARNLVVNGVTYPDVESLTLTDADGADVTYVEEGTGGSSGGDSGGLPSGVTALASGTYTTATAVTSTITINHGLGAIPNFFIMYAEGEPLSCADFVNYMVMHIGLAQAFKTSTSSTATDSFKISRYGYASAFSQVASSLAMSQFANSTVYPIFYSSQCKLKPGVTYRWIAGVLEGI